jgi:hypothetical protein
MDDDEIEQFTDDERPSSTRAVQLCTKCHKPKEGVYVCVCVCVCVCVVCICIFLYVCVCVVFVYVHVYVYECMCTCICCVLFVVCVSCVVLLMCCVAYVLCCVVLCCLCAVCVGRYHMIGKNRVMLSHNQVCEKKCTIRSCSHRYHKKRSTSTTSTTATQHNNRAILAGFKPEDNEQFKQQVQHKMQQAGLNDRYIHIYIYTTQHNTSEHKHTYILL